LNVVEDLLIGPLGIFDLTKLSKTSRPRDGPPTTSHLNVFTPELPSSLIIDVVLARHRIEQLERHHRGGTASFQVATSKFGANCVPLPLANFLKLGKVLANHGSLSIRKANVNAS